MQNNPKTGVPNVYLTDLEKLAKRIRKDIGEDDVEISFEFVIANLFPTSWNNIQTALSQQYTLGYIQGTKDAEEKEDNTPYSFVCEDSDPECYCE